MDLANKVSGFVHNLLLNKQQRRQMESDDEEDERGLASALGFDRVYAPLATNDRNGSSYQGNSSYQSGGNYGGNFGGFDSANSYQGSNTYHDDDDDAFGGFASSMPTKSSSSQPTTSSSTKIKKTKEPKEELLIDFGQEPQKPKKSTIKAKTSKKDEGWSNHDEDDDLWQALSNGK